MHFTVRNDRNYSTASFICALHKTTTLCHLPQSDFPAKYFAKKLFRSYVVKIEFVAENAETGLRQTAIKHTCDKFGRLAVGSLESFLFVCRSRAEISCDEMKPETVTDCVRRDWSSLVLRRRLVLATQSLMLLLL